MKVLQLSYRLPVPPKDGGAIGIWHLLKAYSALGHDVHFIAFNTNKHYVNPEVAKAEITAFTKQCDLVPINTDTTILGALKALLTGQSYNISRFVSNDMEDKIISALQKTSFDIIHVDGVFMAPYIPLIRKHTTAKIVLRAHNIEFKIWEGLAKTVTGVKKIYLNILCKQLKQFEIQAWKSADIVAAISKEEMTFIEQFQKTRLLEAGWFKSDKPIVKANNDFFHIGSMEWMPNKEGIEWFLSNVWPDFYHTHPDAKLHLAGRGLEKSQTLPNGVINHGEVAAAVDFMQRNGTMIVPLLTGAGVRIKLLEALTLGVPCISSDKGVEGLSLDNNLHFLKANTKEEWLRAMDTLYNNEEIKLSLQNQAHLFAEQNLSQVFFLKEFLANI